MSVTVSTCPSCWNDGLLPWFHMNQNQGDANVRLWTGRPPASGVAGRASPLPGAAMEASGAGRCLRLSVSSTEQAGSGELCGPERAVLSSQWPRRVHADRGQLPCHSGLGWTRGLDHVELQAVCCSWALGSAPELGNRPRKEKMASPPSGPREKGR